MQKSYPVPAGPLLKAAYYGSALVVAGAAAWSFKAGFLWTGICILAVAVPIGILYWYMIILNPGRSWVGVTDEGLFIHIPPFLETAIPFNSIRKSFDVQFGRDMQIALHKKPEKGMKLGSYRSGIFKTENGREAIVLANGKRALALDVGDRYVILGPARLDDLRKTIGM